MEAGAGADRVGLNNKGFSDSRMLSNDKGVEMRDMARKERRRDRRWRVVLVMISGYIPQAASFPLPY